MYLYGLCLRDGHGVDKDLAQARHWFQEAAEEHEEAAKSLAKLDDQGETTD